MDPNYKKPKFTRIEKAILNRLSDGETHYVRSMLDCLSDEYGTTNALSSQVHNIRKKLQGSDTTIVCVVKYRRKHYQWVRILDSPEEIVDLIEQD